MNTATLKTLAGVALLGAGLSACTVDRHYYVRTDGSPDVLGGVAHMLPPDKPPEPIALGVTFKSAGKVAPAAADTLFQSVSAGLRAKGQWEVHRLGRSGDDFAPVIAAIEQSRPAAAAPLPGTAAMQRLLVLVENAPDLSVGTSVNYFLSGMTFGLHSLQQPTDRYDFTIAYRDAQGVDHLYRSHQDLVLATSSKTFGADTRPVAGLKHFDSPLDAFNGIVSNSVNGAQKKTITVGKPQLDASVPLLKPEQAATAKR